MSLRPYSTPGLPELSFFALQFATLLTLALGAGILSRLVFWSFCGPILIAAGGRTSYWPFLRARFGFTDEQIVELTLDVMKWNAQKVAVIKEAAKGMSKEELTGWVNQAAGAGAISGQVRADILSGK